MPLVEQRGREEKVSGCQVHQSKLPKSQIEGKKESMNDTFSEKEIKETLLKFIKQEGNAKMHEHLQHASACYLTNYYEEEEKV